MRVRDLLGQHRDDRVAADIGPPPGNLALCVECDAVSFRVAPREPGFARIGLLRVTGVGLRPGVFAAGDAADQPRAAAELFVDALEQPSHPVFARPPAAAEDAAVDARVHVTDHIRLHPPSPAPAHIQAGRLQPTQLHTPSPMTSSRSRPLSHGSSSVNTATHWRHEHGIRVMSVPQNIRSGPNA